MKVERQIKLEEPMRQAQARASRTRGLKECIFRVFSEFKHFDLSTDESTRISPPLPESASCWFNCSPKGRLCFWDASAQQEMMLPPHHFCLSPLHSCCASDSETKDLFVNEHCFLLLPHVPSSRWPRNLDGLVRI